MIQSMTGYGKATVTFGEKKIHVELKSLNSKAMDLSVRIAPLYREKEMEIRTQITKALERGKVDFSLWVEKEAAEMATPINAALMSNYYEQIKNITATTDIPLPADLFATLLRMPDVLTKVDIQELTEEEWNVVRQGIDEAIAQITNFRIQEGAALEKKFHEKLDNIEALMKAIEPYEAERVTKIRERITSALEKGNFYASQGPEIHALWFEDGKVHIECSGARRITANYGVRKGRMVEANGELLTKASFGFAPDDKYIRITVEDANGLHANTNAYFADEVYKED